MNLWTISYLFLWIMMGLVLIALLVLARQIGLIYRRLPPRGAREGDPGPEIGEPAPRIERIGLDGQTVTLEPRPTLAVFMSSTCPACESLVPSLRSIAASEKRNMSVVVIGLDDEERMLAFSKATNLVGVPVVAALDLALEYGVTTSPYAVAIDSSGIVRGKGIVNHLDHLESLVNVLENSLGKFDLQVLEEVRPGNGSIATE